MTLTLMLMPAGLQYSLSATAYCGISRYWPVVKVTSTLLTPASLSSDFAFS
jgi:hypothetical protein